MASRLDAAAAAADTTPLASTLNTWNVREESRGLKGDRRAERATLIFTSGRSYRWSMAHKSAQYRRIGFTAK